MTSTPAIPTFLDVLDSFYQYIANQYQVLNPARQLMGMVNAQDWPQVQLVDGGLYLLYLASVAIEENSTKSQTFYEHFMQWTCAFLGNDLAADEKGFNRASRYRDSMAVVEELRQVHFPGFAPKQFSTVDSDTGVVTFAPYKPQEMISWGIPKSANKLMNAQAGIVYVSASVEVYGFSSVSATMNP